MKSSARKPVDDLNLRKGNEAFADRLKVALSGRNQSEVARALEIAGSTLHRYLGGAMPAADTALRLARTLNVQPEWLIEGTGPMRPGAEIIGVGGDVVLLPRYDLFAFSEHGKPEPVGHLALPATWLAQSMRSTTGLWLAEMPNDALPSLAREGDTLICRDADPVLQDRRVYIFLLDGRPIVRRAFVKADGLQLRGETHDDTIFIGLHEAEHLRPAGRVLSAIHQV